MTINKRSSLSLSASQQRGGPDGTFKLTSVTSLRSKKKKKVVTFMW